MKAAVVISIVRIIPKRILNTKESNTSMFRISRSVTISMNEIVMRRAAFYGETHMYESTLVTHDFHVTEAFQSTQEKQWLLVGLVLINSKNTLWV